MIRIYDCMSKRTLKAAVLISTFLLCAVAMGFGQQVNLTAGATTISLPDGTVVPMWGYTCGTGANAPTGSAACAALNANAGSGWSPVVIQVAYDPAGTTLQINLTNALTFATGPSSSNSVPTSLVIVGQLGGGLGLGQRGYRAAARIRGRAAGRAARGRVG